MVSISTANNNILVSMMQGGGFEKLQFHKAPSICSTVPMEAVVFKAEQPVVLPKGLKEIPSLHGVTQAISMLCKKKEESIDSFVHIKFPFGMVDYNGLKQLQLYHHELNLNPILHKPQNRCL